MAFDSFSPADSNGRPPAPKRAMPKGGTSYFVHIYERLDPPLSALQRAPVLTANHQLLRVGVFPLLHEPPGRMGFLIVRRVEVSHEAVGFWTLTFGAQYSRWLRAQRSPCGDTWHLDEVYCKVTGCWSTCGVRSIRAARSDILVQRKRDKKAAKRFFGKFLRNLRYPPRTIVTDRLGCLRFEYTRNFAKLYGLRSIYHSAAENELRGRIPAPRTTGIPSRPPGAQK